VQRKSGSFFLAGIFLCVGLYMGCHTEPSFRDDSKYRAIERDASRNGAGLAVTAADITAGVERIDGRAEQVQLELDNLETAVRDSALADMEKELLLRRIAVAQEENAALRGEADRLRGDACRLNALLAEERKILAALSEEHDRREAAAAETAAELESRKRELATVKGRRNVYLALLIAVCVCVFGYSVFRALRFFRVIQV
jgi:chromosome segregation ATPase